MHESNLDQEIVTLAINAEQDKDICFLMVVALVKILLSKRRNFV